MRLEKKIILLTLTLEGLDAPKFHRDYITQCIKCALKPHFTSPIKLIKEENSLLFGYIVKEGGEAWQEELEAKLAKCLYAIFQDFWTVREKHAQRNRCSCQACSSIQNSCLRIFIHSGKALLFKESNKTHLSGEIISQLRTLRKDCLRSGEYILITKPALKELAFDKKIDLIHNAHKISGDILNVYYHFIKKSPPHTPIQSTSWQKTLESLKKFLFTCFHKLLKRGTVSSP